MKKLLFIAILAFTVLLSISVFAAEGVVFLSANGNDDAVGSAEAPLASLYAAFRALPYGGTIVVCDNIRLESIEFPASKGRVTLTSVYGDTDYRKENGAALTLSGNVYLKSAVRFERLNFNIAKADLNIVCNGNHTVFGAGLSMTAASDVTYPRITVGAMGLVGADGGYVEVHSGSFARIYGGSAGTNSAVHDGDTTIVIYGGTFTGAFYTAGVTNLVGDTHVYIYGGKFTQGIVGASNADILGSLTVSVYGGEFDAYIRPITDGALRGKCTMRILGGNLTKVYGINKGENAGTLRIDIAKQISLASCPYPTSTLSDAECQAIRKADASAISAASAAKAPATAVNPFTLRNTAFSKTVSKITQFDKTAPGGDLNGDERVSLLDVLQALKSATADTFSSVADINEDGSVSIADCLAILQAAIDNGAPITAYSISNSLSDTLTVYGDATVTPTTVENGYAFGTTLDKAYTLYSDLSLQEDAVVGMYFGCDAANPTPQSGYYFEVNTKTSTMAVYKIIAGSYRVIAERKLNLLSDTAQMKVVYGNSTKENAVQLYFNDNPLVTEHYFDFDLALDAKGIGVGLYVQNAVATLPIVKTEIPDTAATYTNYLLPSLTDPEIFYEDGVYYIYGSKSGGSGNGVSCYSTTDFVTFTSEGTALAIADAFGDKNIVAANVVLYDGIYYMFYLQESTALGYNTTGYATADSPKGPFRSANKTPLTNVTDLIGGQPFIDEDGTAYLVYTRTTGGNRTYISKLHLQNGVATLDLTTETLLLSPTEDWEYAKASVLECGYLLKHGGTYYLLYAGGNYNSTYGVGYATSDNIFGPYTKYAYNPILWSNDQAFGNGAASTFPSPDGTEHFFVYLRNNSPSVTRPLNTCMDRLRFVPNPNGGPDILEMAGPSVNPQPLPSGIGKIFDMDYQKERWHW